MEGLMEKMCPKCGERPKLNKSGYCRPCGALKKRNYYHLKNKKRINCLRNGKQILRTQCVPGCNDSCNHCQYNTGDVTINNMTAADEIETKYSHPSIHSRVDW